MSLLLRLLAALPLWLLHALGTVAGWSVWLASSGYRARLTENLRQSGLCPDEAAFRRTLRRTVAETGKSVLELPAIWFRPHGRVLALLRERHGWEHIEMAHAAGKGIIFLTPHMGCFEITSLVYAEHRPIAILYRPPKLRWLEPLLGTGRVKGHASLAPADLSGVKALLKALKRGEAAGILPDQVPGAGEGVWAPFFGRPAYTMTLAARLAQSSGATVLMAFGERLSWGRGYRLWVEPCQADLSGAPATAAAALNREIERIVARRPEQYLWSYNRYKRPSGAPEVPL